MPGLADVFRAIARRLEPRRVKISGPEVVYTGAGKELRLPIGEIVRIDVFPNIEPPSHKFGIVYSGPDGAITTVEDMDGFLPVFKTVLEAKGMDYGEWRERISGRRFQNPIFIWNQTVSR
jgi:hypothetical protein